MKISDADLAAFLRRLAALYKDSATGNLALSEGLRELAIQVGKRSSLPPPILKNHTREKAREIGHVNLHELKNLTTADIERFIFDKSKTKLELVDLAHVKFSIPRSQLSRMRIEEVREAIKSALMYESSIDIISSEAKRDGTDRRS